jgi:hypothetical protein
VWRPRGDRDDRAGALLARSKEARVGTRIYLFSNVWVERIPWVPTRGCTATPTQYVYEPLRRRDGGGYIHRTRAPRPRAPAHGTRHAPRAARRLFHIDIPVPLVHIYQHIYGRGGWTSLGTTSAADDKTMDKTAARARFAATLAARARGRRSRLAARSSIERRYELSHGRRA